MKKIFLLFFILISTCSFGETIEFWHYYLKNLEKQVNLAAQNYEKKTGNKVIVKKVPMDVLNTRYKVLSEKGGGPDVLVGPADWIGQFTIGINKQNLIEPIDQMIPDKKKQIFLENALEFCTYDNHLFGLPFGINNLALVYNKDLLKTPPQTTKEMIRMGKAVMASSKDVYGLVYSNQNYYYQWLWITGFNGNPLKNKKTTFNSKEQIAAMKFAKSLQEGQNAIIPKDINEEMAVSMFSNQKAAMIITGPWEINDFLKRGVNIAVANLPTINETARPAMPIIGGDVLMLSSSSKKTKVALEFMNYLTTPEVQEIMFMSRQFVPSVKDVYEYKSVKQNEIFPIIQGFMEQAKYAVPMPRDPELLVGVWSYGNSFLAESFTTNKDITAIANGVQEKAINALDEYNKK